MICSQCYIRSVWINKTYLNEQSINVSSIYDIRERYRKYKYLHIWSIAIIPLFIVLHKMKEYGIQIIIGKPKVLRIIGRKTMKAKTKEVKIENVDKCNRLGSMKQIPPAYNSSKKNKCIYESLQFRSLHMFSIYLLSRKINYLWDKHTPSATHVYTNISLIRVIVFGMLADSVRNAGLIVFENW